VVVIDHFFYSQILVQHERVSWTLVAQPAHKPFLIASRVYVGSLDIGEVSCASNLVLSYIYSPFQK
jgi:hypothetical protein